MTSSSISVKYSRAAVFVLKVIVVFFSRGSVRQL